MYKYMLDTNVCIYTIKNQPSEVRQSFIRHQEQLCVSTVTAMELIFGTEKSGAPEKNLRVIEGFLARLAVLDYDLRAAEHTAQLRAELKKQGKPIGPYDQMIVSHARSLGLIVVTNNEREFDRVPGLRIENWVS
ncbi:MAG: type II toxin-antitoxin system tRNA(fMet)-specific endonuclease VapC [Haliea sp.]|jgi:tRNA(fMet)-specific endonuclease VapC